MQTPEFQDASAGLNRFSTTAQGTQSPQASHPYPLCLGPHHPNLPKTLCLGEHLSRNSQGQEYVKVLPEVVLSSILAIHECEGDGGSESPVDVMGFPRV